VARNLVAGVLVVAALTASPDEGNANIQANWAAG